MIRLFVGLELPEDILLRLEGLCNGLPGARWVRPESLHLTLRFIGEVDEARWEDIDSALKRIHAPGFELLFEGIDIFGKDHAPHTLWAGVQRNVALNNLHAKVDRAVVSAGLPPDGRKFSPHVTLARLKARPRERLGAFVSGHAHFRAGPAAIRHFVLFSSFLSRSGAIYSPEASYSLEGA
jgi:RNA 2',3'-cyclic 3'-phosphodiesterase